MTIRQELVKLGISKKNTSAIMKGYEGSEIKFDKFLNSFLGKDLLKKAIMVSEGIYPAWDVKLVLDVKEVKILKKLVK